MENKKSFEEKLTELEKIVSELESGDVSLDDAIEKFTLAMELSKECNKTLDEATETVSKMLSEDGKLEEFKVEEV